MKKIIIFGSIFALFGASVTFAFVKPFEQKQMIDMIGQISTANNGNVFINKFEDSGNTCYVMTSKWGGINYGISCVNSVKK